MGESLDVLELSDEEKQQLEWAVTEWVVRLPFYRLYRSYYNGNHRLLTVNTRFQTWFAELLERLRLNLCESVVDAVTDRLTIASWDANLGLDPTVNELAAKAATKDYQAKIQEAWEYSKGNMVMNEVHTGASVEGDAYNLVWPDATGRLRIWPHKGDEMIVYYPPELPDIPTLALKVWRETPTNWRLNAYWPDRVDRFRTEREDLKDVTAWSTSQGQNITALFTVVGDDEDEYGAQLPNPVGNEVPVAHFRSGYPSNSIGPSDLKNAVPVQDGLNKSIIDFVISGEGVSLPLRILTGVQTMPDAQGNSGGPKYDPRTDIWMNIANEQAKLWTASGADLEKLIAGNEHWIVNMARVTHTPPERLLARMGGVQSGVSRKVAEAPLTSKATTRQQYYDPAWRRTMKLLGMDAAPDWAPTEFETDKDKWDLALVKIQAGMPLPQVLQEMGYDEEQIADMFDKANQFNANQQGKLGSLLTAAFRSGQDPLAMLTGGGNGRTQN